ncbi:MAG: hypothetical protein ABIP97_08280 [Chthoniobacterales bacterium]
MKKTCLFVGLIALTIHSAWAGGSLASAGKLQLFVDGHNVPISTPADEKLYVLFGNMVLSSQIIQYSSSSVARQELRAIESCPTRLVFTATLPYTQSLTYNQKVKVSRIIVSIPKNHLPQILAVGPKKSADLSGYSRKALERLLKYPKIRKPYLPAYHQLQKWTPQRKSSNNAPYN